MSDATIQMFEAGDAREAAFHALRVLEGPVEALPGGAEALVLSQDGAPRARCSLMIAHDLTGAPGRTGMIGHYEALETRAGVALLVHARERLAGRGAERVLGPINGSTWMRYRLALAPEPDDAAFDPPVFAGEPRNPPEYPAHFIAAGFRVAATYESRIEDLATTPAPRDDGAFRIRPIDPSRFDDELRDLHAVSLEAFRDNLFYSPIDFEAFRAMYAPFRARLDPELMLLAEASDGALAGYLFAYADPLSVRDGAPSRVVLKTIGVVPAARGHRVGSRLIDAARGIARERGMRAAIHALMRTDNVTRAMAERRDARVFKRYALYAWTP